MVQKSTGKMAGIHFYLMLLLVTLLVSVIFRVPTIQAGENGIIKKLSIYSVEETAARFEKAAQERGMKIFPRVDHAKAARDFGLDLSPLIVISFGNPAYGTKFMVQEPLAGIDFPPKAMVYEDAEGNVWLAYNSAEYLYEVIFKRHGLEYPEGDLQFYHKLLEELTEKAVK